MQLSCRSPQGLWRHMQCPGAPATGTRGGSARGSDARFVPDALPHAQKLRRQRVQQLPPGPARRDRRLDPAHTQLCQRQGHRSKTRSGAGLPERRVERERSTIARALQQHESPVHASRKWSRKHVLHQQPGELLPTTMRRLGWAVVCDQGRESGFGSGTRARARSCPAARPVCAAPCRRCRAPPAHALPVGVSKRSWVPQRPKGPHRAHGRGNLTDVTQHSDTAPASDRRRWLPARGGCQTGLKLLPVPCRAEAMEVKAAQTRVRYIGVSWVQGPNKT